MVREVTWVLQVSADSQLYNSRNDMWYRFDSWNEIHATPQPREMSTEEFACAEPGIFLCAAFPTHLHQTKNPSPQTSTVFRRGAAGSALGTNKYPRIFLRIMHWGLYQTLGTGRHLQQQWGYIKFSCGLSMNLKHYHSLSGVLFYFHFFDVFFKRHGGILH